MTIVVRRWWMLVVITILAFAAGYLYSQSLPKVYRATSAIMVGRFIQSTELNRDDIQVTEALARNYADLATRQPVLSAVMENLGLSGSWRKLKSGMSVDLVPNTNLLEITVDYNNAEKARLIADEVAHQLILLSPSGSQAQASENGDEQQVRQQLESLQTMIETGQERYIALQTGLSADLSLEEFNQRLNELNALGKLIADWQNNYALLLTFLDNSRSQNRLTVVEPAQATSRPVSPNVVLLSAISGVLGLILALGIIFALEFSDKTIKSIDDVIKDYGVIPLGVVKETASENINGKLLNGKDPFSPESESYRLIRRNIELSADRTIKSLLVTSPGFGEENRVTAANLGIVMAQAGLKTIVVDADLRKPTHHQIFQVAAPGGLAELLASPKNDPGGYLKETGIAHLQLLTSGDLSSHPVKPLSAQDMEQLVSKLSKLADIVIYNGPPAVGVADSLTLSSQMDGVVLVVHAGRTTKNGVRDAVSNLHLAKANLLGVVLHRVSSKRIMSLWQNPMNMKVAKGIHRRLTPPLPQKKPLTSREISTWAEKLDPGKTSDVRDKALILVGYAGAFRRSELISLDVEHLEFQEQKLIVTLPPSKNDAEGGFEQVAIPSGDINSCPVTALKSWLETAEISEGPVFRPLGKKEQVLEKRMTHYTVAKVVKRVCDDLGLSEEECSAYAGHILRTGRATADVEDDPAQLAPMAQVLQRPAKVFRGYVRWIKTHLINRGL